MESQELICKKCNSCGFLTISAINNCPECSNINWIDLNLSGNGRIYSYSKINVGFGKMSNQTPYFLTLIELEEGLNIIAIIDDSFSKKISFNGKVKFAVLTDDKIYKFNIIE